MKIAVFSLRQISDKLLNHLDELGVTEIKLSHDYYWDIPEEQLYNVTENPNKLEIGQLTDDWQELEAIIEGKNDAIGYALVWFAAILRAVGQVTVH